MKIEIPVALPSDNIFYESKHWTARVKLKEKWVKITHDALPDECVMFERPVHITVFAEYKRTPCDCDNVCPKMCIDALKGKVLHDDNTKWVSGVSLFSRKSNRDYTTILIEEV